MPAYAMSQSSFYSHTNSLQPLFWSEHALVAPMTENVVHVILSLD